MSWKQNNVIRFLSLLRDGCQKLTPATPPTEGVKNRISIHLREQRRAKAERDEPIAQVFPVLEPFEVPPVAKEITAEVVIDPSELVMIVV